ncbi:MAG: type 4a pilus biogenesis protein PilO [Planctomycetota bacterium]|nr:type 4a pilus biogenesis protein PilO [Planctomycetota bacterium]
MAQESGIKKIMGKIFRGPKGMFATLLLLGILMVVVVLPLLGAISSARAGLLDTQEKLQRLIPSIYKLSRQMERVRRMRLELLDMKNRYGGADRAEKVFHLLTSVAAEHKVKISSLEPKPKEQKGVFIRIPVRLTLACRYADLAKYLNAITSAEYICVVTSLSITENRELYPEVSVDMQIELVFVDPYVEVGE